MSAAQRLAFGLLLAASACGTQRSVDRLYSVEADVSGLEGSLELVLNETESLTVAGNGTHAFATQLADKSAWSVSLHSSPEAQDCTVTPVDGTVQGAAPSVTVRCVTRLYPVGGALPALDEPGLVLHEEVHGLRVAPDPLAPRYTFKEPLRHGDRYEVKVAENPPGRRCSLEGATGVAKAAVTDANVRCELLTFPLSGAVSGALTTGLVLEETTSKQEVTVAAGAQRYALPAPLPYGASYQVRVKTSPPGLRCAVERGVDLVKREVTDADVRCTLDHLLITEISSTWFRDFPAWIEVHNPTAQPLSLQGLALRTDGRSSNTGTWSYDQRFPLPARTVPPGGYLVIAGRTSATSYDNPTTAYVRLGTDVVPWWGADGAVELLDVNAKRTVDYVRFGTGGNPPTTEGWTGAGTVSPPFGSEAEYGKSLVRKAVTADSDAASDWRASGFATPGAANDVLDDTDSDGDGLPDSAEKPGGTYNGLPLYDWGARVGPKDIFIEVDWMNPSGYDGKPDEGILPRREALEKVALAFLAHNIALHFDVGDLFDKAPGIDPADHDLGGGAELPFACNISLTPVTGASAKNLHELKAASFDFRRRPSFHYTVFANSREVACGDSGSSGVAEVGGNDLVVTLGRWGLNSSTPEQTRLLINYQAAVFMHEFGHNLGLRHGGDVDVNHKPNYVSVMNYLYTLAGLPVLGTTEGDRYYYYYRGTCDPRVTMKQLQRGPLGAVNEFQIDYSDGSGAPLNELQVDETLGLGRGPHGWVDFNWNNLKDTATSANLNASYDAPNVCGRTGATNEVHPDYNDWANIKLPFVRGRWGQTFSAPSVAEAKRRAVIDVLGDVQEVAEETLPPAHLREELRQLTGAR